MGVLRCRAPEDGCPEEVRPLPAQGSWRAQEKPLFALAASRGVWAPLL